MRDIPAIPTRISAVLHGDASLHSTAAHSERRAGKSVDRLDYCEANWKPRPVLYAVGGSVHGATLVSMCRDRMVVHRTDRRLRA
jgi:hypothetical protein